MVTTGENCSRDGQVTKPPNTGRLGDAVQTENIERGTILTEDWLPVENAMGVSGCCLYCGPGV